MGIPTVEAFPGLCNPHPRKGSIRRATFLQGEVRKKPFYLQTGDQKAVTSKGTTQLRRGSVTFSNRLKRKALG